MNLLTWCEVSTAALTHNVAELRRRTQPLGARLGVVVKADAYGHGLEIASRAFVAAGVDWLIVNSLDEAERVRAAGLDVPLYIVGPLAPFQADRIVATGARHVAYDKDLVDAVAAASRAAGTVTPLHLKVETGNHRQGLEPGDVVALAKVIAATEGVVLEGLSTHYADIEDTTDHRFALVQLQRFDDTVAAVRTAGIAVAITNSANSAATILWPKTHAGLVRVGLAAYGLWPSPQTYAAALALEAEDRQGRGGYLPELRPALTWKARLAQVKDVPAGGWIGYGRTYRASRASRIGIVPVGYHEGYDRRLSNLGHMLVDGVRAPVRGRVCMNMTMIDVGDVAQAKAGDVVTLLGREGDEAVTAEDLGRWMGTINYEVVSRIHGSVPRVAT